MKYFRLIILGMLLSTSFAGCTSEDEPKEITGRTTEFTKSFTDFSSIDEIYQPVHSELLQSLLFQGESMVFTIGGWDIYRSEVNGRYTFFDWSGYDGIRFTMPQTIVFADGKVWVPYPEATYSLEPSSLADAWYAYLKASKKNVTLYLMRDFSADGTYRNVLLDKRNLILMVFTRNGFTFAEESSFSTGKIQGGQYTFYEYGRTADLDIHSSEAACFEDFVGLADFVISTCREYFGDVINLNEVFYPDKMLHDPYIYLDELEEYISSMQ